MKSTIKQAERLESFKAGIIAAASLWVAFISTAIVNSLFLAKYFVALSSLGVDSVTWQWLASGAIAIICGLLFGVTYRYAIRGDENFHLKSGTVLAFGLVRGLTQLDIGLNTRLCFALCSDGWREYFLVCPCCYHTQLGYQARLGENV